MNKLSITLPFGAQVCIESEDPELLRETLRLFMPHLTGSNDPCAAPRAGSQADLASCTNDNGVAASGATEPVPKSVPTASDPHPLEERSSVVVQPTPPPPETNDDSGTPNLAPGGAMPINNAMVGQLEYMAFCNRVAPAATRGRWWLPQKQRTVTSKSAALAQMSCPVSSTWPAGPFPTVSCKLCATPLAKSSSGWNAYRVAPGTIGSSTQGAVACSAKTSRHLEERRRNREQTRGTAPPASPAR